MSNENKHSRRRSETKMGIDGEGAKCYLAVFHVIFAEVFFQMRGMKIGVLGEGGQ
jgi:hypothetical protein